MEQVGRKLVEAYDTIAIEDLRVRDMTRSARDALLFCNPSH